MLIMGMFGIKETALIELFYNLLNHFNGHRPLVICSSLVYVLKPPNPISELAKLSEFFLNTRAVTRFDVSIMINLWTG